MVVFIAAIFINKLFPVDGSANNWSIILQYLLFIGVF